MLLHLFVVIFAVSAVLGLLPAYDPALSRNTLISILAGAALYFVTLMAARSRRIEQFVAGGLALAATVAGLYFITQFKYQNYPETPSLIQRLGTLTSLLPRIGDLYIHPNAAATLLELFLPMALALSLQRQQRGTGLLWLLCALVMLYAVLLSYSRGAWVGLAAAALVALGVAALRRLPRAAAFTLVGVVVLVAALVGVLLLSARLDSLPAVGSLLARGTDRLTLYRNSLYLARDYLFSGIGLGDTFGMVYSRYSLLIFVPYLTYSHNLPLAVWLGQGILGLAALAGIVIAFYRFVYRVIRAALPSSAFHGAWLGVTATLVHGLTDARQYTESPLMMPLLFIVLGLTVSLGRAAVREGVRKSTSRSRTPIPSPSLPQGRSAATSRGREQDRTRLAKSLSVYGEGFREGSFSRRRVVLVGGAAALLIGALFAFNRPIRALFYTNMAAINETRAELSPDMSDTVKRQFDQSAQELYGRALALMPDLSAANRRLGNLDVELGLYDDAVPLLEKAYAAEPDYVASVKGLGLAYAWVGRAADAARVLNGLANTQDMVNELRTWGQFRTEQKQPLLAAYAWETAALMRPDDQDVDLWLSIADRYQEANRPADARRWYQRVLEVDATNERAKAGLNEQGNLGKGNTLNSLAGVGEASQHILSRDVREIIIGGDFRNALVCGQ
jgi:O-antigen ligase